MLGLLKMLWVNAWRALHNLRVGLRRKPGPWLLMKVDGPLPDVAPQVGWLQRKLRGAVQPLSIHQVRQRFRAVARTPSVPGVVLELRDLGANWAQVDALCEQVAWLRAQGKQVVAYVHQADIRTYLAASACDRVVMSPPASLVFMGLRADHLFLKDALARVGVRADVFAVSPYKSAYDGLVRSSMSAQNREQLERILDQRVASWAGAVAAARKVTVEQATTWLDKGLVPSEDALGQRMVDGVAYVDALGPQLATDGKAELLAWEDGESRLWRAPLRRARRMVAVVPVHGAIMPGQSRRSPVPLPLLGGEQAGAESIIQALRSAEHNPRVAAVMLHLDTPGGDAYSSDLIWREVARVQQRKPVLACMAGVAASGGYYVAAPCKHVMARASTLTGSIGVIGMRPQVGGALSLLGIHSEHTSRGARAGMFGVLDPLTDDERAGWEHSIGHSYALFRTRVREGRRMDDARLEPLAGGRVWLGSEALERGLVDSLGGFHAALARARDMGGLPADDTAPFLWVTGSPAPLLPEPWSATAAQLQRSIQAVMTPGVWARLPWEDAP